MNFGVLVDVCLGVLSVMILFTLAATAINEMIADNILNMRGKSLHDAILGLARKHVIATAKVPADKVKKTAADIVAKFYRQPAIQALMEDRSWVKWPIAGWLSAVKGGYRPPSAIEPKTFAAAFKAALGDDAGAATEQSLASDFTLTMDRVSGWYVRKVKTSLFVIGLFLAVGANVDLFRYAEQLSDDANLGQRIDATVGMINALQAPAAPAQAPADLGELTRSLTAKVDALNDELADAGLTVGWQCMEEAPADAVWLPATLAGPVQSWACPASEKYLPWPDIPRILCWLIIAFGVTLGAQFWFDLFRSLVNLRTPGKTGGTVEDLSASNAPRPEAKPAP